MGPFCVRSCTEPEDTVTGQRPYRQDKCRFGGRGFICKQGEQCGGGKQHINTTGCFGELN